MATEAGSFTRFTAPALGLDGYFDAISNSFDERGLKTDDGGSLFGQYGVQPGMVDTEMQAEIRVSGIGAPSRVPRRSLSVVGAPARAMAWLLRNAPEDLSGMELDLDSVALRLRIGHHRPHAVYGSRWDSKR